MFLFYANKTDMTLAEDSMEVLTTGAQNIYQCSFAFSPDWDSVDRTAVFSAGDVRISIPLEGDNQCIVPHEVLAKPETMLFAGIYGTKNGELVMPTIRVSMGKIYPGTQIGDAPVEPTPEIYDQILYQSNQALEAVRSLREEANSGSFRGRDGETPHVGSNGNWFLGGEDTGKPSRGIQGIPGINGRDGVQGPRGAAGRDGIQGPQGLQGPTGPRGAAGARGADGYTPVKGRDYFTEADKQELICRVLEALPDGNEEAY